MTRSAPRGSCCGPRTASSLDRVGPVDPAPTTKRKGEWEWLIEDFEPEGHPSGLSRVPGLEARCGAPDGRAREAAGRCGSDPRARGMARSAGNHAAAAVAAPGSPDGAGRVSGSRGSAAPLGQQPVEEQQAAHLAARNSGGWCRASSAVSTRATANSTSSSRLHARLARATRTTPRSSRPPASSPPGKSGSRRPARAGPPCGAGGSWASRSTRAASTAAAPSRGSPRSRWSARARRRAPPARPPRAPRQESLPWSRSSVTPARGVEQVVQRESW